MMAPLAASTDASHALTNAMLAVVERVPQSIKVFACGDVLRACGHLKRYTNNCEERSSVDRLSNCLNAFLADRASLATGECVARNEMSGTVGRFADATPKSYRREDLTQADVAMTSHQTPHGNSSFSSIRPTLHVSHFTTCRATRQVRETRFAHLSMLPCHIYRQEVRPLDNQLLILHLLCYFSSFSTTHL